MQTKKKVIIASAAASALPALPEAGSLLVRYEFTDGSGGTVTDEQGNYNATLGVAAYGPTGNQPVWVASPFDAVQTAGVDADNEACIYILNSTNADAVVGNINDNFTVALKCQILATDAAGASSWWGDATLAELRWQNTAKRVPYWLGIEDVTTNMRLTGGTAQATNVFDRFNGDTNLTINTTYTLAMVIDSSHVMKLYVNGVLDNGPSGDTCTGTDRQVDEGQNTNWTIGARTGNTGAVDEAIQCKVGKFAFWTTELSAAQLAEVHTTWTS